MINGDGEYCKNVDETIRKKSEKSEKMLTFSYFFGRYGVKPLNA
jgi:hypothetical protein